MNETRVVVSSLLRNPWKHKRDESKCLVHAVEKSMPGECVLVVFELFDDGLVEGAVLPPSRLTLDLKQWTDLFTTKFLVILIWQLSKAELSFLVILKITSKDLSPTKATAAGSAVGGGAGGGGKAAIIVFKLLLVLLLLEGEDEAVAITPEVTPLPIGGLTEKETWNIDRLRSLIELSWKFGRRIKGGKCKNVNS